MKKIIEQITLNLANSRPFEDKNFNKLGVNLASSFTDSTAANDSSTPHDRVLNYSEYDEHVLDVLARIYQEINQPGQVMKYVAQLKNLFHIDIPLSFRPSLFRQLNSLLGTLMTVYVNDDKMYQSCFELMTIFKYQIDRFQQSDHELSELEWNELEKSIYLMCDWEDMIQFGEPIFLTED